LQIFAINTSFGSKEFILGWRVYVLNCVSQIINVYIENVASIDMEQQFEDLLCDGLHGILANAIMNHFCISEVDNALS
jgi:hypothetical protein